VGSFCWKKSVLFKKTFSATSLYSTFHFKNEKRFFSFLKNVIFQIFIDFDPTLTFIMKKTNGFCQETTQEFKKLMLKSLGQFVFS
jgi:hypothetical protein